MSTNRDAARAMLKHGSLQERCLAAHWWRAHKDRAEIERVFAPEFSHWRTVAHYLALERSIKHMAVA